MTGDAGVAYRHLDAARMAEPVLAAASRGSLLVIDGWLMGDSWTTSSVHDGIPGDSGDVNPSRPEVRLTRRIMGRRDEISFEGSSYILLPTASWSGMRNRGDVAVVRQEEAGAILQRMATRASPDEKAAIMEAVKVLADTRRPFSGSGLVLARRSMTRFASVAASELPLTPSQIVKASLLEEPKPNPLLSITLCHLYHDDEPIQGAQFELEFSSGIVIKGSLAANGMATVNDVPEETAVVRYGPDARTYQAVEQTKNPTFKQTLTEADFDALAEKYWQEGEE